MDLLLYCIFTNVLFDSWNLKESIYLTIRDAFTIDVNCSYREGVPKSWEDFGGGGITKSSTLTPKNFAT